MSQQQAILFDLDGTLVHSAPDLQGALNAALVALDRRPLDLDTVVTFIGNGVEKLVMRGLEATGGTGTPADQAHALALFHSHYDAHLTTATRLYPGVRACLERLSGTGLPLGICTNKPDGPARRICAELDLARYMRVVRGARPDTPKKPDPAALLAALADVGVTPGNAIFVGDSSVDYLTAEAAGVPFRLFTGGYLNRPLPAGANPPRFDDWHAPGF
ncbi:MAG: phosphoglycolate phosphatase [Rhodobacteraceae bacterium]|nr:phosphoglycolate phosphatase [Paracoccaceae bacterium]